MRRDHGAAVANILARRLVVAPHRDVGQAQYIESPAGAGEHEGWVAESMAWALEHLTEPITVATLARRSGVSPRTYLRHFTRVTGTTPIRWLITQRVQASLALLERTDMSIEQVAAGVGFEPAVTFRHHFSREMRTSPTAYRRSFADEPDGLGARHDSPEAGLDHRAATGKGGRGGRMGAWTTHR